MKTHVVKLSLPTTLPIKDSNQPQKIRLMHKANRSAKCNGRCCKTIISVNTLCLNVKGSLTVPLNRNDVIQQDFSFWPHKFCLSSMQIWSNVRYLNSVHADRGIADTDIENVAKHLAIVVT